jgi:two-component system response regulator YesN
MTSAYLGKVFKKTTGETFSRFVLNERMSKACILLSETDEPIDSVIYSVGFGDTPYFYKLFKQVNGCTPARYRETYRRKG